MESQFAIMSPLDKHGDVCPSMRTFYKRRGRVCKDIEEMRF